MTAKEIGDGDPDKQTGALFYDEDGSGGADQIQIATLSKQLKLNANDFVVGDFI